MFIQDGLCRFFDWKKPIDMYVMREASQFPESAPWGWPLGKRFLRQPFSQEIACAISFRALSKNSARFFEKPFTKLPQKFLQNFCKSSAKAYN